MGYKETVASSARRGTSQPVQARSIATRVALLDAAIESLCADGYAAVTTTDVARRAGVSHGAQQYHFPTKASLLTSAVEHLVDVRLREFTRVLDDGPALERLDDAVDLLWEMFQGPAFIAWVELWMAARTDPDLAATMIEVDIRFTDESRRLFLERFALGDLADPAAAELARDFGFALMEGVALQRLVPRGQRPATDYLDVLKRVLRMLVTGDEPRADG
jgi:AcrR family transcriptional regulator